LFYDWEADALTITGKTVASQLTARGSDALMISQGAATAAPGSPGGGSLPLYEAVKLASKQPVMEARGSQQLSRNGPEYYLFGAPGSAACTNIAKQDMTAAIPGQHCLLAGPSASVADLRAGLPLGVTMATGHRLTVPQGTVVLEAANPSPTNQISFNSPAAQFYVLKDNVALTGNQITNPRQSTDQSGTPDVTFSFTSKGGTQFRNVTAQIAHRGEVSSTGSPVLDQHFAVALDNQLITVPSIDGKIYPDGITGGNGADITGAFTTRTARETAALLRNGVLPVALTPQR
jgi:SecD/SecF fusion protein